MKKVLLIGKLQINIPNVEATTKNVELYSATSLEDVKYVFEKTSGQIDIVIMGAGIGLDRRLKIVEYIYRASDKATVHMKDKASGKEGFVPFINHVLDSFVD